MEDKQKFVAGLRAMADFIENAPAEVPIDIDGTQIIQFNYVAYKEFLDADGSVHQGASVRGMELLEQQLGECERSISGPMCKLIKHFSPELRIEWFVPVESVASVQTVTASCFQWPARESAEMSPVNPDVLASDIPW